MRAHHRMTVEPGGQFFVESLLLCGVERCIGPIAKRPD